MAAPRVDQFAETHALYGVLLADFDQTNRTLASMSPSERRIFGFQLDKLQELLANASRPT